MFVEKKLINVYLKISLKKFQVDIFPSDVVKLKVSSLLTLFSWALDSWCNIFTKKFQTNYKFYLTFCLASIRGFWLLLFSDSGLGQLLALSKTIDRVSPDVHFNKQDHLIRRMKRDVLDLHNPTSRSIACLILME